MTLFTSQSAAEFYDKLFSYLDFDLPRAVTKRWGFPKETMVCSFIVMKCEEFSQVMDLANYLDGNRIIAHYCSFDITKPLPSYWAYDRFLKKLDDSELKKVMTKQIKKFYAFGIVDASFISLDSTPITANTCQNNPKSLARDKFRPENHPKADPDYTLEVHSASNQHDKRCAGRLHFRVPSFRTDHSRQYRRLLHGPGLLRAADEVLPVWECTFLGDKSYDIKEVYNLVKDTYAGEAFIPLNKCNTKIPKNYPSATQSVRRDLPCTRTKKPPTMAGPIRSSTVPYCGLL